MKRVSALAARALGILVIVLALSTLACSFLRPQLANACVKESCSNVPVESMQACIAACSGK